MHIAYLTPEYPHERIGSSGGLGTSIKNLAEELIASKIEVSIVVYGKQRSDHFKENGINFYILKQKYYKVGGFYFYRKHINAYLNRLIKEKGIDLLEAPDWTGITAFMKFKVPLVIRFHGSDTYFCSIEGRPQKWKNRFFETNAIKRAQAFIAPTNFAGQKSADLFKMNFNNVKVIHYGLQLDKFENPHPDNYQEFNLLNIGTLIRKKGVFQLLQIFTKVLDQFPEASLTLIGGDAPDIATGSYSTWELMKASVSADVLSRIDYVGKLPYNEVQEKIKNAHVCVFPSLAETMGMVTIESMALQKTVVNTNIGWAKDIINHGVDGLMHHPDDINGYIKSISRLFDDEMLVKKLGSGARKKVERRFDIKSIALRNMELYQKIIIQ
ncbi:glycosyl transferase family 1 [Nonlabens sp. YIK11]|uniref:glycosyltransferase family 4 protein n=1 Tax=Nonlabens sp. YIK11 TaxID=1453349 RepID=UPI0006DC90A6|nr:glycosyltransferase family 4 protein [Nonlabens sp. YIK11]KQC34129.1 glycosyl transferase family 1 [Nonlabens sp. YIK11]